MRLKTEFLKLPYRFDVDRLTKEVSSIGQDEWIPHPTGFKGNSSVPLISVNGENNDSFSGPMKHTPPLIKCEYIQQIIATFDSVIGRSRLMRLEGRCEVPEHSDINYHWYNRVRIHIPVITDPGVRFICNGREINMQPGEAWIFDTWKLHQVINQNDIVRIHLVIDTSGSSSFWNMVETAEDPFLMEGNTRREPVFVPHRPRQSVVIRTEKYNSPAVMHPGELDALALDLLEDLQRAEITDQQSIKQFCDAVNAFRQDWRQVWFQFASERESMEYYYRLIESTRVKLALIKTPLWLESNKTDAINTLNARILGAALSAPGMAQAFQEEYGNSGSKPEAGTVHLASNQVAAKSKVGRNDPCPCGSGKKYKRCHG